jgi:tetratricopeptide (TPR) repeat protein
MDRLENNMILYRPVALHEMELIYDGGMKAFPARLPQQPIFYPVLDLDYARKTATSYNAKRGQLAGYVTQFKVDDAYISKFEKHIVSGSRHQEFWIPAEEMEEFNRHILGHIKVIEAYFGDSFKGFVPEKFGLQGKDVGAQFTELANTFVYKRMDFLLEIKRNHKAIFLNYPFWLTQEFQNPGLKEKVLQGIKEAWLASFPQNPLPNPVQEENTSSQRSDSDATEDPAPEESPPAKRSAAHSGAKSVGQDSRPVSRGDSSAASIRAPQEVPPAKPKPPGRPVSPEHEEAAPIKQVTPPASAEPGPQEPPPGKPAHSFSFTHAISRNTPPEKPAQSDPVRSPIRENTPPAPPARPIVSHFSKGLELALQGKYQEAVEEFSESVKGNPNSALAHISLGVALHRLEQDDRALSSYDAALKLNPKEAEAFYFRANILHARGNVREAMAEYTRAMGLKPELIEAHQRPAPQDRLTDYTETPSGMYRIARHALRILALNTSLEANPQQAALLKERAAEYSRLENHEQAIQDYNAVLALEPDDAGALHARGLAYEQIGQSERALKDYQRATSNAPQRSDEYINRGIKLGEMGQFRQSLDSLSEGIRLAPGNPNGYFNRGATYLQLGDFEKAIADFSMVIQLSSSDMDAYYWRGISHEEAGHTREAMADYQQFLVLCRDPQAREQIEQRLNQWEEEKPSPAGEQKTIREESQKAKPVQAEQPEQTLDLHDLILALGDRALESTWYGADLDCEGEKAEELYDYTDHQKPIDGRAFVKILSQIRKTYEGDFQAFDPGQDSPWIFLRAWNGSGFYIETNDPRLKHSLMSLFKGVEEVEGASPPYVSLFLPT